MPVTFTPLGTLLEVNIFDDNFQEVNDKLKSGLLAADLSGRFTSFRINWHDVAGRVVASQWFANPTRSREIDLTTGVIDDFDITYRADSLTGTIAADAGREDSDALRGYAFELLGTPGPSLYWAYQEEGITHAVVNAAITSGANPVIPDRYPDRLCYSLWLTLYGASTRIWVPYPCMARVKGLVKGSWTMWKEMNPTRGTPETMPRTRETDRIEHFGRFGLVVDTNPELGTGEWVNSNPHIIDPATGLQSSHKSWTIIQDITRNLAQREVIDIEAEVYLEGGKWYNFSLKHRDAGTHGWVQRDQPGNTWSEDIWESEVNNAGISNAPATPHPGIFDTAQPIAMRPLWIQLIESAAIDIEFDYHRTQAYVREGDDAEFAGS